MTEENALVHILNKLVREVTEYRIQVFTSGDRGVPAFSDDNSCDVLSIRLITDWHRCQIDPLEDLEVVIARHSTKEIISR